MILLVLRGHHPSIYGFMRVVSQLAFYCCLTFLMPAKLNTVGS
ncbi:hypothetical protein TSMEX_002033 [Taenia solium]|eukprot:TsM_000596000 transcript=TsM_000596000 gene=TsM_000596000